MPSIRKSPAACHGASLILFSVLAHGMQTASAHASMDYPWFENAKVRETLQERIKPPHGFKRIPVKPGSFAGWLRNLPMKTEGSIVRLHNGRPKFNQRVHTAVIDIDVGKRDLQQCADAVMRLRAEYLYASKRYGDIAFNFTSGKRVHFTRWSRSRKYKSFRKYMNLIFAYAGTYSLERELKSVKAEDMAIGDIFIKGGFPGHAILVADMAKNLQTGEKRFLLVQSFMPAQDMHVLRNPANPLTPWYPQNFGKTLITPEWKFKAGQLKRF